MKLQKTLVLFLLLFTMGVSYSQIDFESHLIKNAGYTDVFSADLDNDGDLDITATNSTNTVWFKNDGSGNFGNPIALNGVTSSPWTVYADDVDGDGNIDILTGDSNGLSWNRNNGNGSFGTRVVIDGRGYAPSIFTSDLNGDGVNNIISSTEGSGETCWYEYVGNGNFTKHYMSFYTSYAISSADLDNDGDMDIVITEPSVGMFWYKNDGSGNFGTPNQITITSGDVSDIEVSDINGDGNNDIVYLSFNTGLFWLQNDGSGNFGTPNQISSTVQLSENIQIEDMDKDGDMDVLVSDIPNKKTFWFENLNGEGDFNDGHLIVENDNSSSVSTGDYDGDGNVDVLTSNFLTWYENLTPLSVNESTVTNFSLWPNPTRDFLNVDSKYSINRIDIYNQLGQLVMSNTNSDRIDLSSLRSGSYFCKILDNNGSSKTIQVIKQ